VPENPHNRLGLTFTVDNNVIGDHSGAARQLREWNEAGWIQLFRADVLETELGDADDGRRGSLLGEARRLPEDFGVAVWDHSSWDRSVWASEDDRSRFEELWSILKPGVDRDTARRQHVRDVMHVHTALRYARERFITRDAKLLNKRDEVKLRLRLDILSPEDARAFVQRVLDRYRHRSQ
jgi:hypothetical protein